MTAGGIARKHEQNAHAGGPDAIIEPALAAEMLRLQSPGSGLGVFLEFFSPSYFWHSGLNFGFTSVMVGRIEGGVGAVVMTNGSRGDTLYWEVLNAIAEVYDWPDWRGLP